MKSIHGRRVLGRGCVVVVLYCSSCRVAEWCCRGIPRHLPLKALFVKHLVGCTSGSCQQKGCRTMSFFAKAKFQFAFSQDSFSAVP